MGSVNSDSDVNSNSNQTPNQNTPKELSYETITRYRDNNIPIIPLNAKGIPNTNDLFTHEEIDYLSQDIKREVLEFNEKDGTVRKFHSVILLGKHIMPKDFWTDERIKNTR